MAGMAEGSGTAVEVVPQTEPARRTQNAVAADQNPFELPVVILHAEAPSGKIVKVEVRSTRTLFCCSLYA